MFKVSTGVTAALMNAYLLGAITLEKELRTVNKYPIAVQALCDTCTALSFTHKSLQIILMQRISYDSAKFIHDGTIGDWLRSNSFFNPNCLGSCRFWGDLLRFGRSRLNYYSTGFCMIAIALERYILICRPFSAKRLLTKHKRRFIAVLLTGSIISVSLHHFFCVWGYVFGADLKTFRSVVCFFGRKDLLAALFYTITFIAPSILTCSLYILVHKVLAITKSNRRRNNDLTRAFICSSVLWVVLWLPNITTNLLRLIGSKLEANTPNKVPLPLILADYLAYFDLEFFLLQTLVNPAVFVFVSREFQKPMRKMLQKICCSIFSG